MGGGVGGAVFFVDCEFVVVNDPHHGATHVGADAVTVVAGEDGGGSFSLAGYLLGDFLSGRYRLAPQLAEYSAPVQGEFRFRH